MDEEIIFRGPPLHDLGSCDGNLGQFLLNRMRENRDKVAQIDPVTGKQHTYEDMIRLSIQVARTLEAKGLNSGDTISICARNHLDIFIPFLGAMYQGITILPLHPDYTKHEIRHILNLTQPKLIFCDGGNCLTMLQELCESFTCEMIIFDEDFEKTISESLDDENFDFESFHSVFVDIYTAKVLILCSSGSTGNIKGIPISHRVLFHSVSTLDKSTFHFDRVLYFSPLSWLSAPLVLLSTILVGGYRVVTKYQSDQVLPLLERYKITYYFTGHSALLSVARQKNFQSFDLSSLHSILIGGSKCPEEVKKELRSIFHPVPIVDAYASTETTGIIAKFSLPTDSEWMESKKGSIGKLQAGVELKVVDPDTNCCLNVLEKGELYIRIPYAPREYYRNPEASASAFDKDGWFHTGDIGYVDSDNCLYFIGRNRELIKYFGWSIQPNMIESVLLNHPDVKAAVVMGLEDNELGELPMAFVVRKENATVTEQELIEFVEGSVVDHLRLRGGVRFLDAIPLAPNGKIRRGVLSQMLKT